MTNEARNEPNVKREESMFNSREYMDDVLKNMIVHECDDLDRDVCTRCEQETPDWGARLRKILREYQGAEE